LENPVELVVAAFPTEERAGKDLEELKDEAATVIAAGTVEGDQPEE